MADRETRFRFLFSVEKTEDRGLGVFAREPIKKGSIVWRHVPGLFVVYDEHSFRAKIEKMSPADVVYELTHVFGLEDFPGCLILALDDGVLINHSRNPTLVTNNAAPASTSIDVNSRRYLHEVAEALLLFSDQPMVPDGVKTAESDKKVNDGFVELHLKLGIASLKQLINKGDTVKHLKF